MLELHPLRTLLAVAVTVGLCAPTAVAQDDPEAAVAARSSDAEEAPDADPVVTHHTVTVDGAAHAYTATAGRMALKSESGEARADVFYVAYTLDGADDPVSRPITFAFNGGPGSSSVWLHLGALGPRRVDMGEDGLDARPPYVVVDNGDTWLLDTDLVFIDPVTTGYSRAAEGESDDQFHGLEEDIRSVGEFIRLYTTRHVRWASPKFLAGESYGTTRAAGLARYLQDSQGLYLDGVILISSILNFQTARFDTGNDLPYVLFLPTYAATAWYHGRLGDAWADDLPGLLAEVEAFALGPYATTLLKGASASAAEEAEVVRQLARFTGLAPEYLRATNLRIQIGRFCKELRRAERRTVGRLDSRFVGQDRDAAGDGYEFDPSYAAIQGVFTAALNDHVRRDLGFESDLPYEILTGRVRPWSYGRNENRYVDVAERLRQAITQNPELQVFVASGIYDLATPYFATRYTFDHLMLEPELRGNIHSELYASGHMMYIDRASREQLRADVGAFVRAAAAPRR